VPPVPIVSVHVLFPSHVTLLSLPADSVHVLPPAQAELQPAPQLPEHCDCPAQLVVQPVVQSTLHSFFDSQSNVALLGSMLAAPPSFPAAPSEHVPPDWQVHVVPLQEQEPAQPSRSPCIEAPEHAEKRRARDAGHTRRVHMRVVGCKHHAGLHDPAKWRKTSDRRGELRASNLSPVNRATSPMSHTLPTLRDA
jgi:hypothetical protein